MRHITYYNNYINEGLFSSKFGHLGDKIYAKLDNINPTLITQTEYTSGNWNDKTTIYSVIFDGPNHGRDYEAQDEEDVELRVIRVWKGLEPGIELFTIPSYTVEVDGDDLKLNKLEAYKIYKKINNLYKNRDERERERRLTDTINRINPRG